MITAITITGIKYDADEQTKKYIRRKVGQLERYIPRASRKSVSADVKLKQINESHGNKYEVEVLIYLPEKTLQAKDSTSNILAATDIVEAKLSAQLKKYKDERLGKTSSDRRILSRLKRSYAREGQQ